jgi:hypothetical protein
MQTVNCIARNCLCIAFCDAIRVNSSPGLIALHVTRKFRLIFNFMTALILHIRCKCTKAKNNIWSVRRTLTALYALMMLLTENCVDQRSNCSYTVIASKSPCLADISFLTASFIHCEDRAFFTFVACCTNNLQFH